MLVVPVRVRSRSRCPSASLRAGAKICRRSSERFFTRALALMGICSRRVGSSAHFSVSTGMFASSIAICPLGSMREPLSCSRPSEVLKLVVIASGGIFSLEVRIPVVLKLPLSLGLLGVPVRLRSASKLAR